MIWGSIQDVQHMDNNIYRKDREMKKGNYQEIMEEDL